MALRRNGVTIPRLFARSAARTAYMSEQSQKVSELLFHSGSIGPWTQPLSSLLSSSSRSRPSLPEKYLTKLPLRKRTLRSEGNRAVAVVFVGKNLVRFGVRDSDPPGSV